MVGGVVGNTYFTSKDEVLFTDPAILEKCVTGIYNCYNIGSVTGNRNVSGVCGFLSGSASKCYNLGILESTETVVAGVAFTSTLSSVSVADCYYLADCNASGNAFANKVGTALSSKNFRKQASFSGFDFNNTWEMGALAPVLKSFNNKGTFDNPYPIANLEMLEYMRDTVNSGNEALFNNGSVVLLRDIDLGCDENNQWEPIGTLNCFFLNDFDGRGHVITGLYINKPTENYIGFFASYGGGKTVKNLGVYGTVIGNEYVGGIAGMAYAYFENCFNACTVTGNSYVAGIAGYGSYSDYANCYNIGNITCKDNICGGISTDPYYTEVYYCYNFGTIDCKGDDVYPIVNLSKYGNEIKNCYYLDTCYADGTVFGTGDGVSALSEADFADKSKFVSWDFDNTWDLSDSSVKRPLLKNAAEKGTSLNPFKVVYTDDKDGAAIREFYYVTYNEPTPQCQINLTDMASWKFSEWDKPIAAKVTCDVTYTAKISMKDDNTVTFFGNGGTYSLDGNVYDSTIRYYKSAAITVDPECNFTRDGFRLLGWSTMSNGLGTTYQVGDNFEFNYPHNEERYSFYAVWQDTEKPVFVGLENNKTYCKSVKFKVTDNGSIASVKAGDTTLTADEEGYYTLTNTSGLNYQPITVTATDIGGNVETVTVKVNKEHVMSHWKNDGTHYWQCCGDCGVDSAEKYTLPEVQITGSDTVCRNEKYIFTVALPGGCGFGECFGASWNITPKLQADGTYLCVVEDANNLEGKESFEVRLQICVEEHPGFYYNLTKTVTVLEKFTPEITEGNAQKVTAGENTELTFRSNAAFADFIRVEVDGVTIDEKNYTVKEGSTIVTLKSDYMATLSAGEHTLSIVSAGGTATASFTVEAANVPSSGAPNSSATGDSSNVLLWIAVLFVSVIGLVSAGFFKKKKSC